MYNKLFEKILDSSIWLQPTPTRIVWITLLAAMDEDGFAHFSALQNLAERARVSIAEAQAAVDCFLGPDPDSGNPENDGRRVERVPGGFQILNADYHRRMVTRELQRMGTRERVRRYRERQKAAEVTSDGNNCNGSNKSVTQSISEAVSEAESHVTRGRASALPPTFELNEKRTEYAKSKGIVNPAEEFEHFKNHHTAKGSTFKNWDAAWRTWCQNSQRFGGKRNEQTRRLSAVEIVRNATAERAKARGETK